jgi:hypothetical protein
MNRKFYNIDNIQDKKAFMADCISNSYLVLCDELDCSKSWARVRSDKTSDEILDLIDDSDFVHYVFIVDVMDFVGGDKFINTGLRVSSDSVDYFIFAHINIELLDYFVKKYDLKGD